MHLKPDLQECSAVLVPGQHYIEELQAPEHGKGTQPSQGTAYSAMDLHDANSPSPSLAMAASSASIHELSRTFALQFLLVVLLANYEV